MTTSTPHKDIVFDTVGTLVAYDKIWDALDERLGTRLRAECIKPSLFVYTWLEATEREYTYLSLSGRYVPFKQIFELLFWRMLWMAGIKEPREFATKEDLNYVIEQYMLLEMRPGAKECVDKLRAAGFTVWAFTAGDLNRVGGYFKNAGIEMPTHNLLSCDTAGVGKPCPEAYMPLIKQLKYEGSEPWFAAAHMWDVSAARNTGFKGAYCTIWEKEPLQELFGDMEVIADTLPVMADKVIAASL